MSTVSLSIVSRSGKPLGTFVVSRSLTVDDFKRKFALQNTKYSPSRQYFTIGADKEKKAFAMGKTIGDYIPSGQSAAEIQFKDLGPQIAWKSVFFIEYFGPLLVHSLFFFCPQLFYSSSLLPAKHSFTQQCAYLCVMFHYLKREYETQFIHRFSADTMPIINVFKNSFHYWVLGGALIAYYVYHPLYTSHFSDTFVTVCCVIFVLMEFGNLYCHIILRNLRAPGSRERKVPKGFLFSYVTCANYTFEMYAWIAYALFTWSVTSALWVVICCVPITAWSLKKHRAYKKEFGTSKKWILFPLIW